MPQVEEFKYLGVWFTVRGEWNVRLADECRDVDLERNCCDKEAESKSKIY